MSTRLYATTLVEEDIQDRSSPSTAPFATPTLARLYMEQGHHDEARRLAKRLRAAGEGSASLHVVDDALKREDERRQTVLQGLLAQVRANKR